MQKDLNIDITSFKLEPSEKTRIDKIIETYSEKISNFIEPEYIKINLKKSKHGKTYLHEVKVNVKAAGTVLSSDVSEYNPFAAVEEAMKKVLHETEHKQRTKRQIK